MADFKFELNSAGVRELLKSAGMQNALDSEAQRVAAQAGEGFAAAVHTGQKRAYANIYPNSKEAASKNYKENTLLKALR